MILFLDTEFTNLASCDARLLSIALVDAGSNNEFYAEVTDTNHIEESSFFVRENILPQFNKFPSCACSYIEVGKRVGSFLLNFASIHDKEISKGKYIEICFDFDYDWLLLVDAVKNAENDQKLWKQIEFLITPININSIVALVDEAVEIASFENSKNKDGLLRHHALADARALCASYYAAKAGIKKSWYER